MTYFIFFLYVDHASCSAFLELVVMWDPNREHLNVHISNPAYYYSYFTGLQYNFSCQWQIGLSVFDTIRSTHPIVMMSSHLTNWREGGGELDDMVTLKDESVTSLDKNNFRSHHTHDGRIVRFQVLVFLGRKFQCCGFRTHMVSACW